MQVTYYNHYLTDNDVANIARHSFADVAKNYSDEDNAGLIRYLARGVPTKEHNERLAMMRSGTLSEHEANDLYFKIAKTPTHWAPFGHPKVSFRIQAPIFVARQLFKHKIGMVESEESRRYITTEPEFFFPEYFRPSAVSVKQGSKDEPHGNNEYWLAQYKTTCQQAVRNYLDAIEDGVCAEQARIFLPQGTEVNWVLSGSLFAFANLYIQRSDPHAQKEAQVIAEQVGNIMEDLYPVSWAALTTPEGK